MCVGFSSFGEGEREKRGELLKHRMHLERVLLPSLHAAANK